MLGLLNPFDAGLYLRNPLLLVVIAFQVWMLIDAIRRREWIWALFIFIFPLINALLYFFLVYRAQPSSVRGFELPGTHRRKRIRELQGQIHHLDKPHHHAELGDIYFQEGKLAEAERCYRAAIERDPADPDYQAHLGQCLLREGRAAEAAPLLERIAASDPRHDYGHTLMAYAEALGKLGRKDEASAAWRRVLEHHGYARARVQYAELCLERGEKETARKELAELIEDEAHAAAFQRKQDRVWVRKAKTLLRDAR